MTATSDALARTVLLINNEYFDGAAATDAIVEGLVGSTVRIHADADNLRTRAGQAAVVTTFGLIARMGIGIELAIPDVPLIDRVAPLLRSRIRSALVDLGGDLVPGSTIRTTPGRADLTVAFGSTPLGPVDGSIRLVADDYSFALVDGLEGGTRFDGDWPLGAFAGAAAIAAAVLEVALHRIEEVSGIGRGQRPRPSAGPPAELDLRDLFPGLRETASREWKIDLISGGAISNALLFVLLRLPGITVDARVIEGDVVELSNLNRYMLLRARHTGALKTAYLEGSSSSSVSISGVSCMFTQATRDGLRPLAPTVLVGADRVEVRWLVQEEQPEWLCVGATEAAIAETTSHSAGSPCAGCSHPDPLPEGVVIPTISFVSFWAGLMQACELLCHFEGQATSRRVMVWPFALGGSFHSTTAALKSSGRCALSCSASRTVDDAA